MLPGSCVLSDCWSQPQSTQQPWSRVLASSGSPVPIGEGNERTDVSGWTQCPASSPVLGIDSGGLSAAPQVWDSQSPCLEQWPRGVLCSLQGKCTAHRSQLLSLMIRKSIAYSLKTVNTTNQQCNSKWKNKTHETSNGPLYLPQCWSPYGNSVCWRAVSLINSFFSLVSSSSFFFLFPICLINSHFLSNLES